MWLAGGTSIHRIERFREKFEHAVIGAITQDPFIQPTGRAMSRREFAETLIG